MIEPEKRNREVWVYDPREQKWVRGRVSTIVIPKTPIVLTWTDTGVAADVVPDEDKEVYVEYARSIVVQVDTTNPSNTSTSIDLNVYASLDGAVFDNYPWKTITVGDGVVRSVLVDTGVYKIRLRVDNNAAGTTGYVRAVVYVRE